MIHGVRARVPSFSASVPDQLTSLWVNFNNILPLFYAQLFSQLNNTVLTDAHCGAFRVKVGGNSYLAECTGKVVHSIVGENRS